MENECFECDICCEEFDETGSHVPLVMPCGHTLCFQCVGSLQTHVCPTCKHPLSSGDAATVTFPRNNWLIRCLGVRQMNLSSQAKKIRAPVCVPVSQAQGQRVLFKQLMRACDRTREGGGWEATPPRAPVLSFSLATTDDLLHEEKLLEEKKAERSFFLHLSKICKEKKAQDQYFDQKRFVKEGLIMKFGEEKAKRIILQVNERIKLMRRNNSPGGES